MNVEPGQLIGGKYELERLLGKGAMGEVWLARHATLDDSYAVKLIDVNAVPDAAARFRMEAHIAAKLSKRTRHIVSVTDHGEQGQLAYLVMQLLEGETLADRIATAAPLSLGEVSAIVTQVARALTHAHDEGFVHRDLKPANVFLTKDEDGRVVVKLLDFGIARVVKGARERSPFVTAKDTIIGTPSYMSPEQARALDELDQRCDLWALAVVAYEALTGAHPFEGETLQDVLISIGIGRQVLIRDRRPDLPDVIGEFFDTAFADEIELRFASAQQLARTFARACGAGGSDRPSMAPPTSIPPMPQRGPSLAPSMMPGPWLGADGMPSRMPRPPRLPSESPEKRDGARQSDGGERGDKLDEDEDEDEDEETRGLPRGGPRSPWVWVALVVVTGAVAACAMVVTRASRPREEPGLAASASASAGARQGAEADAHAGADAGAGEGPAAERAGTAAVGDGGDAERAASRAALDARRASTANGTARPVSSPSATGSVHVPAPARSADRGAVF